MVQEIPTKVINSVTRKIKARCKELGVQLIFDKENKYLDEPIHGESSAFFTVEPIPTIEISMVDRTPTECLLNLLHEEAHLDQWLEQTQLWTDCYIGGIDVCDLADLWICKKIDLTVTQRKNVFDPLFRLELDAENRTVDKIAQHGLRQYVDVNRYTQEAHAYINGYRITSLCRKWIPADKPPYLIEEIVDRMPIYFDNRHYNEYNSIQPIENWISVYAKHYSEIFPGSWFTWGSNRVWWPDAPYIIESDYEDAQIDSDFVAAIRSFNSV